MVISPDGRYSWNGKRWKNSPKGTIQKFVWDGKKWGRVPPEDGGTVFSPDGQMMWTGKVWIPAPPDGNQELEEETTQNQLKSINPLMENFGNHDKEFIRLSRNESSLSLVAIIFTFIITSSLFNSQIVQPMLFDASLINQGRHSITFDAWNTISEDDGISIVAIGSSMIHYSIDGICIEEEISSDENLFVYNLGAPGSMPYMEMIQTEAAISANPELILLEVGPNSLWDVEEYDLSEFFELKLTIYSLTMELGYGGEWEEILRESEKNMLDYGINQLSSESKFANDAVEELLTRILLNETSAPSPTSYASVPHPNSNGWQDYLRTPKWLFSKLELMDEKERSDWENVTVVNKIKYGVNNPLHNGTLNHAALEYMVSRFSESGIEVVLVSPPLHPLLIAELEEGQYDGHNTTLSRLSEYDGVSIMNLIWEDFWSDDDFYDHNHLDRDGRKTFCQEVGPRISDILED
tara:strand:+ start:1424 stop:2818 length:1395 start_codon:yes stop_codon:yes gene_type:complete